MSKTEMQKAVIRIEANISPSAVRVRPDAMDMMCYLPPRPSVRPSKPCRLSDAGRQHLRTWRAAQALNAKVVQRNSHGKAVYRTKHRCRVSPMPDSKDNTWMSLMSWEYIRHCGGWMVYTALDSIYTTTSHPHIGRLLDEAHYYLKQSGYADTMTARDIAMTPSVHRRKRAGLWTLIEEWHAPDDLTADAKEAEARVASTMRYEDLVSVAVATLADLANDGMIACYQDVWHNASEVYKAVNQAIRIERRSAAEGEAYNAMLQADNVGGVDACLEAIGHSDVIRDVSNRIVVALAHEGVRAPLAGLVWVMRKAEVTYADIADRLDLSQMHAKRLYNLACDVAPFVLEDVQDD